MSRTRFFLLIALCLAIAVVGTLLLMRPGRAPSLEVAVQRFLADEQIAGAVIAYGRPGGEPSLVAFGEAAPGRAMQVTDRLRLASLAKPMTAAAVLHLIALDQLSLDSPVPEAGPGITIRHLLQHSGGWDRAMTSDPISDPAAALALGLAPPYDCHDVARLMPPAQFAPGSRHAYSNIGYCWLGRVIEEVTGRSYEDFVREAILTPRGATLAYGGVPSVAHASDWPDWASGALGPGGGWTGTAGDYWRFAAGPLDSSSAERPDYAKAGESYYGLGWRIWPDGDWSHFGAIPGVFSFVLRGDDGVAVLLFNGRPRHDERAVERLKSMLADFGF